jgi:serine protease Do
MQNTNHRRAKLFTGTALRLILAASLGAGGFFGTAGFARAATNADTDLDATAQVQKSFTPLGDFTGLVKRVTPAVVSVDVHLRLEQTSDDDSGDNGSNDNGPGSGFPVMPGFPPGLPFGMVGPMQAPQPVEAMGSGFIINPDGVIVTNNHVVKDAKTVTVTLSNGQSYPAKVLGTDPRTDLAVLKINAGHPLPYLEFGNSADVEPGEWVVAMGNPFGLDGTVTAGIVSALGRDIGDGPYDRFIQVDAPINEGNSGGPLFNAQGQVIGVNTAIYSPSGGSVGIGFAIPSDLVKNVADQLAAKGQVVRGYLGVSAQQVTKQVAQAMQLPTSDPDDDGALVAAVMPDSPASHAGLEPGDVITNVDGQTISNPSDLSTDIAGISPGTSVHLHYLRAGKSDSVSVALQTLPANPGAVDASANAGPQSGATVGQPSLGLTLAPLTPETSGQLNLPNNAQGAVIVDVKPNSPADQAGLQAGDLLVGVDTTAISGPDQAVSAIDAAKKAGVPALALRIVRQGQPLFVGIGLDGKTSGQG